MTTLLRALLRVALGALLLGALVLQTQLPLLAEQLGGGYAETAHLVVPYAAAGIAALACLQVALVAVWWLVTRVERDEIFAPRARRGLDAGVGALLLGAVCAAAPMVHLLFVVGVGGPGILLGLLGCVAGAVAVALLGRTLRAVLGAAVADHAELAAVV
ncbi:integral membrane protein [Cellulomonas flavigena DSM 20109]|uniref:Integral membrane protein n=1 Tax=Cellulomonas flavigena (strain ATCC 482 / DSM 20109 / BCRC 11376 / JCM 18109 / NBRC 3775 / NCIMB 8073 / NRS 134) TaxID=446466 RepID=D5UD15_CELFN|nr:DUF2975 domain-containing protein [Cellulomonas flavigena]ADG74352.1 integral membrane protein [Cellulomonas flavigena DSM 20109]